MADNVLEQAASTETQTQNQPDYSAELAQQMQLSLSGGMPPAEMVNTNTDTATAADTTGDQVQTVVTDPFSLFKEKFGYETPEAAISDIERLRAFESQPRVTEFQVPDDESARILKALAAGNKEEVWRHLDREMKIERLISAEVNKDIAADIVKLGMQLKYKDLTPDEINYRFNKQFAIPPQPVKTEFEEDGEYQARMADWQNIVIDKQMELMIEAKLAKPELQNSKTNFTYPEIDSPIDEDYIQYKKALEEQPKMDEQIRAAYKALSPKSIATTINFKDEANKIDFQYQYEPNAEKFAKAQELAGDMQKLSKFFTKPDGTPDREKFVEALYFALDKENYLLSALNQSKNATLRSQLPDNTQTGLVRQLAQTQEPNELDQHMRASLKGYGGF